MGGGSYDAYVGNKRAGYMIVDPRTKSVQHVHLDKPFRGKKLGHKFYDDVIQREGGLFMNPDTSVPQTLKI